jgi:transcriptional regulator with GAF, ATPase, and Fis domain
VIQEHHLPQSIQAADRAPTRLTLGEAVERLERQMIEDTLREQGGSIAATARELGTTERIVRYKAQKLGLDPARFRNT